jgi:two-component system sensor histidine kinase KdpD
MRVTGSVVEPAGHFRIYLGPAPGVGKTYAMLSEGHRRRGRGTGVVAGFVEAYERPLTEALITGLEVVPRKGVDYRGSRLEEMDLDATRCAS